MKRKTVEAAKSEVLRFVEACDKVLSEDDRVDYFTGTKLTGAMRRASMDLSRKLSDLRQGR